MLSDTSGIGYSFKPMMGFYSRWLSAPVEWIESREGRNLLAKVLRHCRKQHGRERTIQFINALVYIGVYPCFAGRF